MPAAPSPLFMGFLSIRVMDTKMPAATDKPPTDRRQTVDSGVRPSTAACATGARLPAGRRHGVRATTTDSPPMGEVGGLSS
ncbi:hypothetical protein GCM10010326_19000 [Streptomyces xanthochromogenes]|uniref:Uncharacterized protein n=1 Tax=Streptomyces xanthochromogenes TaxID=67384 RepID=A0ABQ2ZTS7_9ACTN|nr:hypothetical protein GCM10010326_19000 [Streptomyces xanthochromogenes]